MIDQFGNGSSWQQRYIPNHDDLNLRITGMRQGFPGIVVVLVMGAFDIKHVGHDRFLERAAQAGAILARERQTSENYIVVVGVDSDEKISARKGANRPVVSLDERVEQLCHLRHVTLVTCKNESDPHWNLIKITRPDILIATQETYSTEELLELKQYCQEIQVHPPQSETSSTARIRLLLLDFSRHVEAKASVFEKKFQEAFSDFTAEIKDFLEKKS